MATYIEVLAAALSATVKVNGTVTTHEGGYSIFRADVTDLCHDGENELTIEVSTKIRRPCIPLPPTSRSMAACTAAST